METKVNAPELKKESIEVNFYVPALIGVIRQFQTIQNNALGLMEDISHLLKSHSSEEMDFVQTEDILTEGYLTILRELQKILSKLMNAEAEGELN